jgi:uncharacterized protein (TIGR03437 family)
LYIKPNVSMKLKLLALLLPVLAGFQATAQTWDTSGNGLLNGTYYFRQVIWAVEDDEGDVGEAIALYGNITFNGTGQYTVSNVQVMDSSVGAPCTIGQANTACSSYPTSGNYYISASGYGFLDSLVTNDEVYGLVSNGIWVASSTENSSCQAGNNPCYNDMFLAVPVPSTPLTDSAFQGTYTMADVDFTGAGLDGGVVYTRGSTFQMTPNGSGSVPSFTATGYIAGNGSTKTTQSVPAASYNFSSGAAVYNLAGSISSANANTVLIAGQKYFYLSPDGNFVIGGSPTGWDMIVGVRTGGTPNFNGLYYQAGVLVNNYPLASDGYADLQTYYGSYNSIASANEVLAHQRIDDAFNEGDATDYTYEDTLSLSGGIYSDSTNQYAFSSNGAEAIGFPTLTSEGGLLGVTVLLQAPSFSGSGVYIYPIGVLNNGSSVPFTAQLAPGELLSIYGTNLASTTQTDLSLPTSLGGTQVMINSEAAPIAYVSSSQINVAVPIDIAPGSVASIQVVNGSGSSNIVTNFVGDTQPGVFNGNYPVPAVQHADYSMVTTSSPVQPGETILVYMTGLGQLSGGNATEAFQVGFYGLSSGNETSGTIAFAGSQSTVGGGYQMNIQVPSSLASDNYVLDIVGPDSENFETVVPVGTSSGTASLRKNARAMVHRSSKERAKPDYRRNPVSPRYNPAWRRAISSQP